MTPSKFTARPAKVAAVALGLLIPLLTVGAHRVPAGTGKLGFDVEISSSGIGELSVAPEGRVALASGLVPGGRSAAGDVIVQNQTAARLGIAPVVSATDGGAAWIAVTHRGRTVTSGPLSAMRDPQRPALTLAPGERARLRLFAWLPRGTPPGWEGRVAQVQVGWRAWVGGKVRR